MRTRAMVVLAATRICCPSLQRPLRMPISRYDNLRVVSVDGAVLVVSDDRKTAWSEAQDQGDP